MKNKLIDFYANKFMSLMNEAEDNGVEVKHYSKEVDNIIVERGFTVTDNVETMLIPTWKMAGYR